MKVILLIATLVVVAFGQRPTESKKEVCYDKYGCFSTDAPWTSLLRPLSALPAPPYEIATRFVLFCRGSEEYEQTGYDLLVDKDIILEYSPFDPSRPTVFIIHGFTDSYKTDYIWESKDALLQTEDMNIILVDWAAGAKSPYLGATANARLVGAQVAAMLTFLEAKGGLNFDDVHVIGHNLGAHAAGYAGDRTQGRIPRITGIDPSDPYFGDTDPIVRLDSGDAKHVEVIHTNGNGAVNLGMGIVASIGDVDYFVNGGRKQPGCSDLLGNLIITIIELITLDFEGAIGTWACSHVRGAHFYVESILDTNSCPFVSYSCEDYNEFEKGNCFSACHEPGRCLPLGHNAKNFVGTGLGNYYLHTGDGNKDRTYCMQSVQIQAVISSEQEHAVGTFSVQFKGADGTTSNKYTLVSNSDISPGQLVHLWAEVPNYVMHTPSEKNTLILRYTRGGLNPIGQPKTLAIDRISLLAVDTDFTSQTISYNGVTIEYATDTEISE